MFTPLYHHMFDNDLEFAAYGNGNVNMNMNMSGMPGVPGVPGQSQYGNAFDEMLEEMGQAQGREGQPPVPGQVQARESQGQAVQGQAVAGHTHSLPQGSNQHPNQVLNQHNQSLNQNQNISQQNQQNQGLSQQNQQMHQQSQPQSQGLSQQSQHNQQIQLTSPTNQMWNSQPFSDQVMMMPYDLDTQSGYLAQPNMYQHTEYPVYEQQRSSMPQEFDMFASQDTFFDVRQYSYPDFARGQSRESQPQVQGQAQVQSQAVPAPHTVQPQAQTMAVMPTMSQMNVAAEGQMGSMSSRMTPMPMTMPVQMGSQMNSKRFRVIRGISAGGCSTRPPKQSLSSDSTFLPVELKLTGASVQDICFPQWSPSEKEDRRRIIRIERTQNGPHLMANFSIVGSANENPVTVPPMKDVDVVEVSCLECATRVGDEYDSQSSDDEKSASASPRMIKSENGESFQYYITSVEVVEIVELLIGTELVDPAERRRERGRVRSNLVPFWSKKPISSRMHESTNSSSSSLSNIAGAGAGAMHYGMTNQDFRLDLAKRIMGYEIRKPRGFDKEVRILRWDKLVPALKRALQSYYTEIPSADGHMRWQ